MLYLVTSSSHTQDEKLKAAAVKAREQQERKEATASISERIEMNARRLGKKKELRKEEVRGDWNRETKQPGMTSAECMTCSVLIACAI